MRLLFILFLGAFVNSHAHETYFSFAEMEYNELSGKMEATLTATAHDLEKYYQKEGKIKGELSKALLDSSVFKMFESELNNHFYIDLDPFGQNSTMDGAEMVNFQLEGFEFELTGLVRFYLSCQLSRPIEKTFGITYNLLMDTYPEQQNKLTFIHREKKATFVFLPANQKQFIDIH